MTLTSRQRAVVNAGGIVGCRLVAMVVGVFMLPFMIGHLGKEDYGVFQFVRSFLAYLPMLSLAVGPAISRYVTHAIGRDDRPSVNRYMSTGLAAMMGVGAMLFLASCGLAVLLPRFVELGPTSGEAQVLLVLLGATSALSYMALLFETPLYARERLAEQSVIHTLSEVLRAALIVAAFVLVSARLVWVGAAALAGAVVSGSVTLGWAFRVFPWMKLSLRSFRWSAFRELLSYSAFTTLGTLVAALYFATDNFIIKWLWGAEGTVMITVYSVAASWHLWIRNGFAPLMRIITPRMTLLSAAGRREQMQQVTVMAVRYATALMAPVCVILSVFAVPILKLWLGDRLTDEELRTAAGVMQVLLLPLAIALGMSASQAVFVAEAKIALPTVGALAGAVGKVALSVLLGGWMGWGLAGVAAGTGITILLRAFIFAPYYLRRVCGLPIRSLMVGGLARPGVLAVMLGLGGWLANRMLAPQGVAAVVSVILGCVLVYAIATWFLVLFPEDRARIWEWTGGVLTAERSGSD